MQLETYARFLALNFREFCRLMHARPGTPGARELKGGPLEIADPREGPVHGVACISYSQGATYACNPVHKLLYSKGDPLVPSIRESNLCTGLHAYVAQRGRPLRWAPCICGYSTAGVIYKTKEKKKPGTQVPGTPKYALGSV